MEKHITDAKTGISYTLNAIIPARPHSVGRRNGGHTR